MEQGKGIQAHIDEFLLAEQEKRKSRERSGCWSPSSFGRCFRMQYWNRKNEPQSNPPDARSLLVFKAGQLFHDFVQGFFENGVTEVVVKKDDVFGYADLVTEDSVFDIKSQHSKSFWYMKKSDFDVEKEKIGNILQVCCYAWILGKKWGKLVFVSKDDLCTAQYDFLAEKFIPQVEAELKSLRGYWSKDVLPPAQPRAYGIDRKTGEFNECSKYCGFRDHCKEVEVISETIAKRWKMENNNKLENPNGHK